MDTLNFFELIDSILSERLQSLRVDAISDPNPVDFVVAVEEVAGFGQTMSNYWSIYINNKKLTEVGSEHLALSIIRNFSSRGEHAT